MSMWEWEQEYQRRQGAGMHHLSPPRAVHGTIPLEQTLFTADDIEEFRRIDDAQRRKQKSPRLLGSSKDGQRVEHGDASDTSGFVTGFPLACLMAGLMFAQFLISIDRTIISTVSADRTNTLVPLPSGVLTRVHLGDSVHHPRIPVDA
ncbi:hypothetical protein MYCTH_2296118 [Thermothelomyces thermophilus ATCC 42464]|uniref:Uncharacterized protein n=1 Tax=Thermothelomyces thermophilus (strain ATCC 42464 / BCRC 31852 / DSM 1799) TaxID=573729 RepID=G2Q0I2_THET4|nr:uncharacterized protein MYCTH_2296118 [Thermothelomyces thermophilus ATCC 42464]AEO54043.1 hypothetical protein MYCTH_2296118 [Thermothelomyces thermophilus ATCC 42464]